jgi:DNA repair protein RecO (recombination protein O)
LFDVVRTAIAFFMIELFQHTIKQPEANPELFYLLEGSLTQADKGNDAAVANLPLYFSLHLAAESGFGIQGNYSVENNVLDLQEGAYTSQTPLHSHFIEGNDAAISSRIQHINFYNDLEEIKLSRETRNRLLNAFLLYTSLHITEFKALKSLTILQEVLS